MRHRILVTTCFTLGLIIGGRAASAELPRIRTVDAFIDNLFASGVTRSATFRDLVDRLERSDVLVHIEPWRLGGHGKGGGALWFVGHAGGFRYLRIRIDLRLPHAAAVALLGHELQHALEVAHDPSVVSLATFDALYRRIGDRCRTSGVSKRYDTHAARDVQGRIGRELRSDSRPVARR